MEVSRAQFLAVVQACMPGTGKSASLIEGAEAIVFDGSHARTNNDLVSVAVPFEAPGLVGTVKASELAKLLTKLNGDSLQIEAQPGVWSLKCGRAKAEMKLYDASATRVDIPEAGWVELPENFTSALKLCTISGNRTPLAGIFVSGEEMASSNTITINRHTFPGYNLPTFWVEDNAIRGLFGFASLRSVAVTDAWAHFKGEDGTIYSCRTKSVAAFPKARLDAIIQNWTRGENDTAGTLPETLGEAVSRAEVFGLETSGVNAVKLAFLRDTVTVSAERAVGRYEETVDLPAPLSTSVGILVSVDATFLREACQRVKDFYIHKDPGAPVPVLVFHNEHYLQIASTLAV